MNESNDKSQVLRSVNIIEGVYNNLIIKLSNSNIDMMKTKGLNKKTTCIFKRK